MPDKKLTDKEIVKALECCVDVNGANCHECPYDECCSYPKSTMLEDALDLINRQEKEVERLLNFEKFAGATIERQEAEIERLKTNLNVELDNFASEYDDKIKAEAYKECIEKVKEIIESCHYIGVHNDLNNLLKELVGE